MAGWRPGFGWARPRRKRRSTPCSRRSAIPWPGNPKERLTALFHHITPDALGAAYFALKKDAAAGVDGVTWDMYGEGLIIDELGFVPLSKTGAELLFEVFSQRYERGSILVTSNLPFDEWTEIFGSERLTGALLDRLTHHVHILEMNGESYRRNQSQKRRKSPKIPA